MKKGQLQALILGGIILFLLALFGAKNGDISLMVGIIGTSVFIVCIYFWHKKWRIRLVEFNERKKKGVTILFFFGLFVLLFLIATMPYLIF